jgi:hypothetical protein
VTQEQHCQTVQQWQSLEEKLKRCNVCRKVKGLSDFPTNSQMHDGHRNECKRCTKQYIREWRDKNLERLNEKGKLYAALPDVRERTYRLNKVWRENNQLRMQAHSRLGDCAGLDRSRPKAASWWRQAGFVSFDLLFWLRGGSLLTTLVLVCRAFMIVSGALKILEDRDKKHDDGNG